MADSVSQEQINLYEDACEWLDLVGPGSDPSDRCMIEISLGKLGSFMASLDEESLELLEREELWEN